MKIPARLVSFALLGALLTAPAHLHAQSEKKPPLAFDISVVPLKGDPSDPLRRGEIAKLVIAGKMEPGYYTYPRTKRTGLQKPNEMFNVTFGKSEGIVPLWPVEETPEPVKSDEQKDNKTITKFKHKKDFTWTQDILILPDAKPGKTTLPITFFGQSCDDRACVPFRKKMTVAVNISDAAPVDLGADLEKRRNEKPPEPTVVIIEGQKPPPPATTNDKAQPTTVAPASTQESKEGGVFGAINVDVETYEQQMDELAKNIQTPDGIKIGNESGDLMAFLLAGIFWGAVSLITPCVFPMIPITVSFFLKQSEKTHHRPIFMALIYSGTIVLVLTLAAAFLLSVFRALSINPIMNYGLGALFIFFALSLFGMYEIELPSGLARFTSSREGQGGVAGTIFMALTFTIISFACVAPFLGGFGGTSAGMARPWWHNILGGLAFSVTFAAPFFLLALFPTLLRSMPKSGSWLNSVKVVMGFLELAAAFKFFRSAELVQTGSNPWLFTFDFVLGIYVALCFLSGLYLLGFFRLPHDTPEEHLGVPRMLFAGLFVALGLYLMPALFKTDGEGKPQRPGGAIYAWVDSFLLPDARPSQEEVTGDLGAAIARARQYTEKTGKTKRVFVDFTGVVCTNCNINEESVFPKAEIAKLLDEHVIVKIYTDTVPAKYFGSTVRSEADFGESRQQDYADVNYNFQSRVFNATQLPLYAILEPTGAGAARVLEVYPEGRINNEAAFAKFLSQP